MQTCPGNMSLFPVNMLFPQMSNLQRATVFRCLLPPSLETCRQLRNDLSQEQCLRQQAEEALLATEELRQQEVGEGGCHNLCVHSSSRIVSSKIARALEGGGEGTRGGTLLRTGGLVGEVNWLKQRESLL